MRDADRGCVLLHVLPTGPGRTVILDLEVRGLDIDIYVVHLWQDGNNDIAYEDIHGTDINSAMSYAVTYIHNPTDSVQNVFAGFGSDDSCFVRVNGEGVSYHNEPRGSAGAILNTCCIPLEPGMNSIMFKTFEGESFRASVAYSKVRRACYIFVNMDIGTISL